MMGKLHALLEHILGDDVFAYAYHTVKKSVIGVHGVQEQIHMMVKVLLPRVKFYSRDAADALALAICHSMHRKNLNAYHSRMRA
ncbi:Holliday junction resolvasome RuvABC endonuclease subunit [Bartonella silvatica]|uniref:Holliday junction resolvasome RuvABC endonuclease subunit n=1 Tax=Bartonella silvatica TaxID=357760 RepID=A0ABV2HGF8_9HYPH